MDFYCKKHHFKPTSWKGYVNKKPDNSHYRISVRIEHLRCEVPFKVRVRGEVENWKTGQKSLVGDIRPLGLLSYLSHYPISTPAEDSRFAPRKS